MHVSLFNKLFSSTIYSKLNNMRMCVTAFLRGMH